jgi:tRNA dimethylallyltransferase
MGANRSLIVIAGPTGSGKSSLAIEVALRYGGEILNCDSVQIYRHFDLGSAKIPVQERRGVPHHLIGIAEPDEVFTAGDYARAARRTAEEVSGRGRVPVVAGGTGFYLRAFLEGLAAAPARDEALRRRLVKREERRPGSLHRILRRLDRAAAVRIHPRDVQKTVRAVEACLLARRPLSEQWAAGKDPIEGFRILRVVLNPERAALRERLDARLREMFARGLVEETRRILGMGYPARAKPFESLGYRQALQVIGGELTEGEALAAAQVATRQYAKRQITWFRREPGAKWFEGFGEEAGVRAAVFGWLDEELGFRIRPDGR